MFPLYPLISVVTNLDPRINLSFLSPAAGANEHGVALTVTLIWNESPPRRSAYFRRVEAPSRRLAFAGAWQWVNPVTGLAIEWCRSNAKVTFIFIVTFLSLMVTSPMSPMAWKFFMQSTLGASLSIHLVTLTHTPLQIKVQPTSNQPRPPG
uniref:Uncharacterized protein n=1 Tax=Panagrellus redivivus TaxID=6233 RepID=A0A7E4VQ76_PANRE